MVNLLIWMLSQFFSFKQRSVWFKIIFDGDFIEAVFVFDDPIIRFLWLLADRLPILALSLGLYFLSILLIYLRAESMLNLNYLEDGECEFSKSTSLSSKSLGLSVISLRLRL